MSQETNGESASGRECSVASMLWMNGQKRKEEEGQTQRQKLQTFHSRSSALWGPIEMGSSPGTVFDMEIHNQWSSNCPSVMKPLIRLIESLNIRPTSHVWAEINSEYCAGSGDSQQATIMATLLVSLMHE